MLLPLQGVDRTLLIPKALPWAVCLLGFHPAVRSRTCNIIRLNDALNGQACTLPRTSNWLVVDLRPERARSAPSPGQRPVVLCPMCFIRPVRAKALFHIGAFAILGIIRHYTDKQIRNESVICQSVNLSRGIIISPSPFCHS